jgi:cysteine desulfurase / selenocysteine lyase
MIKQTLADTVRGDFPILHQDINGHPLVYLDNAATGQKPTVVINALLHYYEYNNANVHRGVHQLSERATYDYENARKTVQYFLKAKKMEEIVFTRNATEAINLVAQSYARPHCQPGDEILITEMEHHSNIVPWQMVCQQTGARLVVAPMDDTGTLDLAAFADKLSPRCKMLAINHVSNALGTINPVKEMIAMAHERGIPVLVDGAQAAPHQALNMRDLQCDFYVFTGHKLFAPTGIGVLYAKAALLEAMPPYQGGGEMIRHVSFTETTYNDIPFKFEAGTPNIAGAIGLAAAIDYITNIGMENIQAYEHTLLKYATERANAFDEMRVIGSAKNKTSILSFTLAGIHAHDIGTIVDQQGIAIRTGHHCAMPVMQHFKVPATARASFAFYNTQHEVDRLFDALQTVLEVFS